MQYKLSPIVAIAALAIAGCGGSGGVGAAVGQTRMAVFLADSMDSNDHVWVTIHRVELLNSNGSKVVFSSDEGRQVDLRSLHDGSGERFKFLIEQGVDQGTYTGFRVTMDKDLVVFPSGATDGVPMTFDNAFDAGAGRSAVTFNFPEPKTVGGDSDNLVVEFDLANWNESGGVVMPVLKQGSEEGLDNEERHESDEYEGVVSALEGTAPNQKFTLHFGDNYSFRVELNADTVFEEGDAVANGDGVQVEGRFDPISHRFVASSIEVHHNEQGEPAPEEKDEVRGHVTEVGAGVFVRITADQVEGFLPFGNTVRLEFADDAVFQGPEEAVVTEEQFFAAITQSTMLEAEGVYNPDTKVLTASKVRIKAPEPAD